MLIILVTFAVYIFISAVTIIISYLESGNRITVWVPNLIRGLGVTITVITIICSTISIVSYTSYLKMVGDYNTIIQYEEAIERYDNSIILDLGKVITDFAYKGHAKAISGLIKDLRDKIVRYNTLVCQKKVLKKNIFFGKFIIGPNPDMKIIHVKNKPTRGN